MDSLREKLVELIRKAHKECKAYKSCHDCPRYGYGSDCVYLFFADHLIANGVTVQDAFDNKAGEDQNEKCKCCVHKEACLAWIRHGKALYEDFVFSTESCPYFEVATDNSVPAKWIPVTERLPEEGEDVMVFGYWHEKYQTLKGYRSPQRKGRWFTGVAGQEIYAVTHWMPLPEPPKEG